MTLRPGSPADPAEARTAAFRRYLVIRLACLVAAALALAAVVLAFAFKGSPVEFGASLVAFVVLYVVFQVLMRKRRAYFSRWIVLKDEA